MKTDRLVLCLLGCLSLLLNGGLAARTLEDLQNDGRLRIDIAINPQEDIVARQQVTLQIEVATDRWFSGGMRIGHFEVKDAIVLQREKFAVNSTTVEGDKTWTRQLWTLVVYPQRGGLFEVPPIPLKISVADDSGASIVGEISTPALGFLARIPQSLESRREWVATDRFEVAENFNKSLDGLQPGDALVRTITVSADNLPAMMLPQASADSIPGIAVYPGSAKLTDKVNRGAYRAERSEVFTYVLEQSGNYRLEQQTFYWWDVVSRSLQSIVLEAVPINVSGPAVGGEITAGKPHAEAQAPGSRSLIISSVVGLVLAILAFYMIRKLKRLCWRKASAHPD
ncbi:MAG: hypothetical protein HKN85_11680, partial [Gammaproteobacteria bacterium]|nr:hypothetical protein [Gammaproteobacteria bacterium]